MPDTLPIRYAQSLLRLAKGTREELREELGELKLPLVLLQHRANPEAQIAVEDYGRLFIHLVKKLQPELMGGADELSQALGFSAYNPGHGTLQQPGTGHATRRRVFPPLRGPG